VKVNPVMRDGPLPFGSIVNAALLVIVTPPCPLTVMYFVFGMSIVPLDIVPAGTRTVSPLTATVMQA
jgi:hypothetical protein